METVLAEVKRQGYYNRGGEKNLRRVTEKPGDRRASAEKKLIALAAGGAGNLQTLKQELTPGDFTVPEAGRIATVLFGEEFGGTGELSHLILDKLSDEADKKYLIGAVLSEHLENPDTVLRDCVAVIKGDGARSRITELKVALREAERVNDGPKIAELISALNNEIY